MYEIVLWTVEYILNLLFWLWILRWGGAEFLEGRFLSGILVNIFAINWSSEGIKLFALLIIIGSTILFILGLIHPDFRIFA